MTWTPVGGDRGDPTTTETMSAVDHLARPVRWSNAAPLPVTFFGMREKIVPLDDPVPELVSDAAARSLAHNHQHNCRVCDLLRAIHIVCYVPLWRTVTTVGSPALFYVPTALLGSATHPVPFFLFGWIVSAAIVHILLLLGVFGSRLHRRRLRQELALRTITANLRLRRPLPNPPR